MVGEIRTEQTSPAVSTIRIPCQRVRSWEQWVLLSSDRHIDNPKSDLRLQKRHLDEARERKAIVIDCGDLFDAMQGKFDPRGCKKDLRGDLREHNYLDALVDNAYTFLEPYAENVALLGYGNHETGVIKRHETDLTKRLVDRLHQHNDGVLLGGYRGWIRIMFRGPGGSYKQSCNIYYSHGSCGNSPVTKGVLRTSRRSVYLPDADIVCTGHIHEQWVFPITRARLSSTGREYTDEQVHIQIPTYKEEFLGEDNDFHHEKEGPPKPIGAWWLRFYWSTTQQRIVFDTVRAK